MEIKQSEFITSAVTKAQYPQDGRLEVAFVGRSNVGKSSLINMITGWSKLAKTSVQPGKTRTINHFLINEKWYLVDLPGYGYAKVPIKLREEWVKATENYILKREKLVSLFVLLDVRHKPQRSDLDFMEFLGLNEIPFARVFTKSDKLNKTALEESIIKYDSEMLKNWDSLPISFISSAVKGTGRDEILNYIQESINNL